ncbi:MAG: holo-ACP synthase [Synechococcales cyanobacterium M58_A2018_015]|nr:holo-ACP synthase [Synechococcales cyanobacterium M58_A2018_015]
MNIYIGTDIVYVPRIQAAVERFGERFLQRIYTPTEQQDCRRSTSPECPIRWQNRQTILQLAGRWAAKEAVVKALGTGWRGMSYTDIEIRRQSGGAPQVYLYHAAAAAAECKGRGQWRISLSHDGDYAVATALFWCSVSTDPF